MGWRFLKNLQIEDAGPNKFLFTFDSLEEKEKVLRQEPWNFKGSGMILGQWSPGETVEQVELSKVSFWVQIHGLPLGVLERDNAILLGSKLGEVIDFDDLNVNRSYLRVKIWFDATNPLQPGFSYPVAMLSHYGLWSNTSVFQIFAVIVGG